MNAIAKFFAMRVKEGKNTLEEVPEQLLVEVMELLNEDGE